jgi:2,3-bisphosphoglycerate-dependent phosphoglycerate mutase
MNRVRVTIAAAACLLSFAVTAAAQQQVVFLVRHAERAETPAGQAPGRSMLGGEDPPLSPAGEQRAARLAAMLASADITHVFTTEYRRTRDTAKPLAEKLKVTSVMSAARDPEPLIEQVRRAQGNVLIVGHSNTVPDLVKRLGVKETVAIADSEYDNLFIVVRPALGEPTLIRLRF